MKDLILSRETGSQLDDILCSLVGETDISTALLINRSGRLIAGFGGDDDLDTTTLSALVAGSFSSIITMLNIIGGAGSDVIHSRNDPRRMQISLPSGKRNIHISLIGENTYLAAIFGRSASLRAVKAAIKGRTRDLMRIMEKFYEHVEADPEMNLDIAGS